MASKKIKETTSTGGTASATPGTGEQFMPKVRVRVKKKKVQEDAPILAGGKVKDIYAVTHFGFTKAPSKPNRKSKAIDYKQIFEDSTLNDMKSAGFNINKVWDFIESKPFYNKDYMPKFNTAEEIWNGWGPEEKEMYSNFEWNDTYGGDVHPREKAALQKRKTYDALAGIKEEKEEKIEIDDRVKVVYGNQFYGETGTVVDLVRGFAIIEMDSDGEEYSMHISDVEKIEDEEDQEELTELLALSSKDVVDAVKEKVKELSDKLGGKFNSLRRSILQREIDPYEELTVDAIKQMAANLKIDLNDLDLGKTPTAIQENYARFRNETSKRTGPEQLHKAVKAIKTKLHEVDKLLEYTQQLKSEISEGSEDFKYMKHTERTLEQVTEAIKQIYIKSKKIK